MLGAGNQQGSPLAKMQWPLNDYTPDTSECFSQLVDDIVWPLQRCKETLSQTMVSIFCFKRFLFCVKKETSLYINVEYKNPQKKESFGLFYNNVFYEKQHNRLFFFVPDPDKSGTWRKRVPPNIQKFLNTLILYYWFMFLNSRNQNWKKNHEL
jgi:hypothetical protein